MIGLARKLIILIGFGLGDHLKESVAKIFK